MNCLLLSHQLDRSGAPLALLDLAIALKSFEVDVEVLSIRDGPLAIEFRQHSIPVSFDRQAGRCFDLLVANTLIGAQVSPALGMSAMKRVAWIHESPTFYRYHPRLSFDYLPAAWFDLIAGVARFQVAALKSRFPDSRVIRFDNVFRGPQNHDASLLGKSVAQDGVNLALIAGFEPRKGVASLRLLYKIDFPVCRPITIHCFGMSVEDVNSILPAPLPHNLKVMGHGKVSRNTVYSGIRACDAMISLSQDEVKPLTILEAVSAGKDCFVTRIPAHEELASEFEHVKLYIDPLEGVLRAFGCESNYLNQRQSHELQATLDIDSAGRYSWEAFLARTELLLGML